MFPFGQYVWEEKRGIPSIYTLDLFIQIGYGDNFLFYFNPKIKVSFLSHTVRKRLIISNKHTMQVVIITDEFHAEK